MESTFGINSQRRKIYKSNAIWIGSFFGGPLVAGYIIAENFKELNKRNYAIRTWFVTIISTILIFGGIFLIPNSEKIPKQLIPTIYTLIAYLFFAIFQEKEVNKYINLGGATHKIWRVIAIGFIGFIITLTPLVGYYFYIENSEVTRTYGTLKHEIVYDKNDFSESEIDQIAYGLMSTNFFDSQNKKTVYVEKTYNNFILSIPVIEGIENKEDILRLFVLLKEDLQTFIPKHKITINLVVDDIDNVVYQVK